MTFFLEQSPKNRTTILKAYITTKIKSKIETGERQPCNFFTDKSASELLGSVSPDQDVSNMYKMYIL